MFRFLRQLIVFVLVCSGIAAILAVYSTSLSALAPGFPGEAWLATEFKQLYIARAARNVGPEPPDNLSSIAAGQMAYGMDCSSCHGEDGRTPAPYGRHMYPPVLDLGSAEVQEWSNAQLFWIIKNGIRHSGMPGFGTIHTDDTIWDLVHYVRSIPTPPKS